MLKIKNKKEFILNLVKLLILISFVTLGLSKCMIGIDKIKKGVPPERPIIFQKTMHRKVGPNVGSIKIKLIPTHSFIVGDHITAFIEIKIFGVDWMKNETCMVELLFPDAIVYIDSWSNITMQDYPFTWWKYESHDAVHAIYIKQVELWYPHEGIFGVNITVWQPKLGIYGYNKFYFPDLVQIKSYSYVEEKRRAFGLRKSKGVIVIPVILSPCAWQDDFNNYSKILALPTDAKPVLEFENRDKAWLDIYNGLKKTIEYEVKVRKVKFKGEFEEFLQDTEILSKAHPQKETVLLDDIFIYPELDEYDNSREFKRKINSRKLIESFYNYQKVIIAGEGNFSKYSKLIEDSSKPTLKF